MKIKANLLDTRQLASMFGTTTGYWSGRALRGEIAGTNLGSPKHASYRFTPAAILSFLNKYRLAGTPGLVEEDLKGKFLSVRDVLAVLGLPNNSPLGNKVRYFINSTQVDVRAFNTGKALRFAEKYFPWAALREHLSVEIAGVTALAPVREERETEPVEDNPEALMPSLPRYNVGEVLRIDATLCSLKHQLEIVVDIATETLGKLQYMEAIKESEEIALRA